MTLRRKNVNKMYRVLFKYFASTKLDIFDITRLEKERMKDMQYLYSVN